jgi:hypothetical protein
MLKTPVAIFGFNRPEMIKRVFERVREAKPVQILIILDGPRLNVAKDKEKCNKVKDIFSQIDWPCEVKRNYADTNMGCKTRMETGISWVFEQVEEAILLEDDCLPEQSFFQYCSDLLVKYRDDMRVGMIAGHTQYLGSNMAKCYSYYFDTLPHIWGWATWKRAWKKNDIEMVTWPVLKQQNMMKKKFLKPRYAEFWTNVMDATHEGKLNTWDSAWALTMFRENFLCIHPNCNLISNIGFGGESTHTKYAQSPWSNLPTKALVFPLIHPLSMNPDFEIEKRVMETLYAPSLLNKILKRLSRIFDAIRNQ